MARKVFKDYGGVMPSSAEKPFKPTREGQDSYMVSNPNWKADTGNGIPDPMEKQGGPSRKAPPITRGTKP